MKVTSLTIYPVKGCRGISLQSARIDALGFVGDRRFMIVDETGKMLTQRTEPRLALIETALTATTLRLSYAGKSTFETPLVSEPDPQRRTVGVWSQSGLLADDCGDDASAWLASVLGQPFRLVRIGAAFRRPVKTSDGSDLVTFADAYPFLIISEASLDDLNDRLTERGESPLPMNRFRPNLVIAGCRSYEEDTWPLITINGVRLRPGGPCARCIVTTTDQETLERGKEPLRTLASYRRDAKEPTAVNFGQNFIHVDKTGEIRVADLVEVVG